MAKILDGIGDGGNTAVKILDSKGDEKYKGRSVHQLPSLAWRRKFDDKKKRIAYCNISLWELIQLAPFIIQVACAHIEEISRIRVSIYNPFRKWMPEAALGVPLGGIGSGGIGRSYTGYFQQFQLFPNTVEQHPVPANQFSVFIKRPNGKKFSTVLSPKSAEILKGSTKAGVRSWDWNLKKQDCSYYALYPRSWTVYEDITVHSP